MQQVLFHIPILQSWFGPDGIPVHGFGVMLFVTFLVCVWFLAWRARRTGTNLPKERVQDLVIVVFVAGLAGARITYMIVEGVPWQRFFRIWEGGIVLYGGIITGILAFLAFHHVFLKKAGVSIWKLADVAGPGLALGIALGRVGCFLNGCCYGHIAPEGCPSSGFPLLTCPARDIVVERQAYQTPTGFTVKPAPDNVQSIVDRVEPLSAADRAGLKAGDRIVGVNGRTNGGIIVVVSDEPEALKRASETAQKSDAIVEADLDGAANRIRLHVEDPSKVVALRNRIQGDLLFLGRAFESDVFTDLINNWSRGRQSLTLDVQRGGQTLTIGPFTPRTLGLHPTQLYETISMFLLIIFLMAYYPYRRHDGQVFTLFIAVYAVHRFLNESLRNDTEIVGIPQLNMTLSQNISILMLLFAAALEIGLRLKKPSLRQLPASPSTSGIPAA
jgi:prolipoprotein diacylglyceryltransferase